MTILFSCLIVLMASYAYDTYQHYKLEKRATDLIRKQHAAIVYLENRVKELTAAQDKSEEWKKL